MCAEGEAFRAYLRCYVLCLHRCPRRSPHNQYKYFRKQEQALKVSNLQQGVAEGGVYYSNAIAEHRVIQEALQPCSEKVHLPLVQIFRWT